jgi:hypothetical protein
MTMPRKPETAEERMQRLAREAQMKRDQAAAEDASLDRMVRRSIQQFGP